MGIKKFTTEKAIIKHLDDNGQMLKWLADKIGVHTGHLHHVLKGNKKTKRVLTESNLQKINEVLKTDF